ncbi:sulfotransferase domain-containing protein [Streptomyces sp. NPDC046984]|uniref:sulfotransferase domain-containing protein n=1 Tax=Streptomyces sp. NPDC046984 TaxID=3155138 RepID=UPI0033C1BFB1
MPPLVRYANEFQDSERWHEFPFREGDIVISTRSKSGTTWVQMICALLVFGSAELPEPLPTLSPWLDMRIAPKNDVYTRLAAQQYRRFIKTHTPLDGVPADPRVTYIVVGRHPLDMAVSMYHHTKNLDMDRIRSLSGQQESAGPAEPMPSLHDWVLHWVDRDVPAVEDLDALPGVLWHISDAWARRNQQPNVLLVHYADLLMDLEGEMRRLAQALEIDVPEKAWSALVEAATFNSMKAQADRLAPNAGDVLKDSVAFFHRGTSDTGRQVLTADELAHYEEKVRLLVPSDVWKWLHR